MFRIITSCFLIVVILLACKRPQSNFQLVGSALGTTYNIQYHQNNGSDYTQGLDSIFRVVNRSMSTYQKDSDISRINRNDTTVVVDAMFVEVFELSKKVHRSSSGAFDPTVGQLVNAYGFGSQQQAQTVDSSTIYKLHQAVGFDKLKLTNSRILQKSNPDTYLEFNAVAKGYCIDRIGVFLENQGVQNYLIELGGELLAKGINISKQKEWVVGIDDPNNTTGRSITAVLRLKDQAMATSGNYRKFRIDSVTGAKYVHSIDPRTGYPRDSSVLSASVLAPSCAEADAYATTFMILPLEETKNLVNKNPDLEAYIIYHDTLTKEDKVFVTPGFEANLVN